jgi:LysM repeat protein
MAMETVSVRMRTILLVSIVLNVALAVALVTWLSSAPDSRPRVVRPVNAGTVNSNLVRIVKTNVLVRPRAFTWQEIESADYAQYVQNLRDLRVPEKTIRDIIVADIDELFAQRRRAEAARQDFEWWRATPSADYQSNIVARAEAIETERNALLTKLLGQDWAKDRPGEQAPVIAFVGPVLGNLPESVRESVANIAANSRDRIAAYLAQKQAGGEPPNEAEMARIREEVRQQLASVLNPQQLEEFLVRYSENAARLRQELAGFDASPEEFRALFRVVDSIDRESQLRFGGDDPASQRARENLEAQRLAAIRNALGPERFQAYQTARDPAYREALAAAQQAGGNENTALALYEIQRATAEELSRITSDPTLTAAEKQAQAREAELEQLRARSLVLGDSLPETALPQLQPQQPQLRAHAMEPGETLGQLAVRFGVSVRAIREANPGVDINRVRPGTVITIPPVNAQPGPPLPPGLAR